MTGLGEANAQRERVPATALAWLLLPPALAVAAPTVLLLAPWIGALAFPAPPLHYWAEITVVRKPAIQAGYPLAIVAAIAYVVAIVAVARRGVDLSRRVRRTSVALVQVLGAGLIAACWLAQRHISSAGTTRVYFTSTTLLVAALLTALATASLALWGRRLAHGRLPSGRSRSFGRAIGVACAGAGVLATCVWVLPGVYTDAGMHAAPEPLFLGAWFFDESSAVLNGRSPLVNMVAYGALWPYVVAIPLRLFHGTYAAFTVTMTTLTGASLLAVLGTLLLVTRRAALALALYLPVLAMSFFLEHGEVVRSYSPGNYYGMFPLRYAGPFFLALLTAVYVAGEVRRRRATILLFTAAGLVVLNNTDFGVSALMGSVAAIALTRPAIDRRSLVRLGGDVAAGLAASLALVSLLTLVRAGTLPHLGLLLRYGRIFVVGGNGNLALPGLGLHVVITLTFLAALATAGARAASGARDVLTGMLAWAGMFGLGAGIYYYAYRSHPDVLINLFPIWTLALALLAVVVGQGVIVQRRPSLPAVVVLFGFAVAACTIAQVSSPWSQARRIEGRLHPGELIYYPGDAFRATDVTRHVAEQTRRGEHVLVLSPTGHRVARAAGVSNVSPYPGLGQMPAREQLDEALDALEAEGGEKVFVSDRTPPELEEAMALRRYRPVRSWRVGGWPSDRLTEYRRAPRLPGRPAGH